MLQFESKRVVGLSDDGQFVFVEGHQAGLPMNEVTVVEAKQHGATPAAGNIGMTGYAPQAIVQGFNQDVYTLGSEGKVILQWPEKISQESYEELSDWMELQLKKIARLNKLTPKA